MKLGYASDFHTEILRGMKPRRKAQEALQFLPGKDCVDAMIFAGDMGDIEQLPEILEVIAHEMAVPVYFTPGNHEFYRSSVHHGRVFEEDIEDAKESFELADGVTLLMEQYVDLTEKTSLWMSPWWTDFRSAENQEAAREAAARNIADYRCTALQTVEGQRWLTPEDHVAWNLSCQRSLEQFNVHCTANDRTAVVATHWAPSRKCEHVNYPDDILTPYFCTDYLDRYPDLLPVGSTWIYGHTHWNCDLQIGNVRVTSNQLGYSIRKHLGDMIEFSAYDFFNPLKYIEVK